MKIILSTKNERFAFTRKTFREFTLDGEEDTLDFRSLPRKAMRQFFSLSQYQQKKGRNLAVTYMETDCDRSFTQLFFVSVDRDGRLNVGCKFFTAIMTNEIRAWALVKRIPKA